MMARQKGFTFIEVVIVAAIISVLAGIAWQQYHRYVLKAGRTEATAMLLDVAARQERYHVQTGGYVTDSGKIADLGLKSLYSATYANGTEPLNSRYTLGFAAGDTTDSFRLTATVRQGTAQAADTLCEKLTVDDTGAKGHNDTPSEPGECW